jgi:hypothetical protein
VPLANELVGEAVANCAQKGYAVTAAVVDLGIGAPLPRNNVRPRSSTRHLPGRFQCIDKSDSS